MDEETSTKLGGGAFKAILTAAVIFVGLGLVLVMESGKSSELTINFCDVGQGDGFFVATSRGEVIVIDGGPGTKITQCMSRYMPFWDRKVELMVVTHPQQDHMEGEIDIFKKYKVEKVLWTGAANEPTQFYSVWKKGLEKSGAAVTFARRGDLADAGEVSFEVLWPTAEEMQIFADNRGEDINNTSIVARMVVKSSGACAYFTGDVPFEILDKVLDKKCQILKVAHHGSKTGTDKLTISEASPEVALISVGKNNRYGHPYPAVVEMFDRAGVKVLRTDQLGDIRFVYDKNSGKFTVK